MWGGRVWGAWGSSEGSGGEDSLEQQSSALALAQMLFLAQMRAKKVSQLRNCVLHHEGLYEGRLHFDFLAEDLTSCFFWEQLQFIASCPTCTIPLAQNMSLQDHTFFATNYQVSVQGMVRWSKTNFDCFFCVHLLSQRTRTGLRHSTYIYFSILLHLVAHVCTALYTHRSELLQEMRQ